MAEIESVEAGESVESTQVDVEKLRELFAALTPMAEALAVDEEKVCLALLNGVDLTMDRYDKTKGAEHLVSALILLLQMKDFGWAWTSREQFKALVEAVVRVMTVLPGVAFEEAMKGLRKSG